MKPLYAIPLSFLPVLAVLGLATLLAKKGVGPELTRKFTHILLSNWILAALFLFRETWAVCIPPACFVVINYIAYRKGLLGAIQRREHNTPGTVWFAVSLLVLCAVFWQMELPWIAACGMLAMGYGDGLAALVGLCRGRRALPPPFESKSLEGTLAVAIFTALPVGLLCGVYAPEIAWRAALCCGVPAMAVELLSPRGIDNLTLPLTVSLFVALLYLSPASWAPLMGLSLSLLILLPAFVLRAVTLSGMLAGTVAGTLLYALGGGLSFGALVLFFVAGSLASRLGKAKKSGAAALHRRSGPRGAQQVAANCLPPLLWVVAYAATGGEGLLLGVLGCFAGATADTLASEIGMLSRSQPVSLLGLRPIARGLSGGVTLLGLGGSALGALLIALLALPRFALRGMGLVLAAGVACALADSLLGLCQVKYRLPSGLLTERPTREDGTPLPAAAGLPWLDNDMVNALSILLGSLLCTCLW